MINRILYVVVGAALIVLAFVFEVYPLIFIGACIIVPGLTGGNSFTKKFEGGFFRDGLFKKRGK